MKNKPFTKKKNFISAGIVLLALFGLIYFSFNKLTTVQPVLISKKSSAYASPSPVKAASGNRYMYNKFLAAIFNQGMNPSDEDPEKMNEELRSHNTVTVNVDDVKREAEEVVLPYNNETERQEVLKKLQDTEKVFSEMISTTEKNINEAKSKGTRTPEEIKKAEDALTELNIGRDFVARRIQLVEKNKK